MPKETKSIWVSAGMVLECHASIQRAKGGRVRCRAPSTRQHAWAKLKPNEGRLAKGSNHVSRQMRREPEPSTMIASQRRPALLRSRPSQAMSHSPYVANQARPPAERARVSGYIAISDVELQCTQHEWPTIFSDTTVRGIVDSGSIFARAASTSMRR